MHFTIPPKKTAQRKFQESASYTRNPSPQSTMGAVPPTGDKENPRRLPVYKNFVYKRTTHWHQHTDRRRAHNSKKTKTDRRGEQHKTANTRPQRITNTQTNTQTAEAQHRTATKKKKSNTQQQKHRPQRRTTQQQTTHNYNRKPHATSTNKPQRRITHNSENSHTAEQTSVGLPPDAKHFSWSSIWKHSGLSAFPKC